MYTPKSADYQQYSAQPPPPYGQPAAGIPVSSTDSYYGGNTQLPVDAQPKQLVPWSTGLCDCFEDVSNCCLTFWCPCITFGRIAEIVDKGATSCGASGALYTLIACVIGCPCFYSCFYRAKMRQQYSLEDSACGDCCLHCWCESCALCQEYRELKFRGFDMVIGWQGNVEKQNREVAMAPVVEDGMTR